MSFLEKQKANLAFDASSITSTSTGSITGNTLADQPAKVQRQTSIRKPGQNATINLDGKTAAAPSKKNVQPLRLPPITLGPLSGSTAAKIAALKDQGVSERNYSPPPTRHTAKTPTTPMTASKSSFFSRRHRDEMPEPINLRSSSSIHHGRVESPLAGDNTSSSDSIHVLPQPPPHKAAVSPFLSSSVPKGGMEAAFAQRAKTGADFNTAGDMSFDAAVAPNKPSGPRAPIQKLTKTATATAKSPGPLPSPDEQPQTPSSITSLRRKLSMSWKRKDSKSSINFQTGSGDKVQEDNGSMPPPRIPVSSNLGQSSISKPSSPTSTTSKSNGTYLDSRRRKTSASSLSAIIANDRKGEAWAAERGLKKDTIEENAADRSAMSVNSSVMQKILRPRASANTIRHHDVWTADLDKDDLVAEEEMRKLGTRRKETELAARTLDALRKRATPKERVSAQDAIRIAMLNIYERGEIVDYNDIYFCGTQNAAKVVGDLNSDVPNFGYDDERGDYTIVPGDHLAYRYEIIDILGKGSFGQVVRCIDHKTGVLVAVKIIRNKKRFHQQALVEVNILQKLREWVSFCHPYLRESVTDIIPPLP
jgi:dual specificity tyrosine-phosphorylation-regulated kinase 2/3/4